MKVQQTFSLAEVFETKRFSQRESLLDIGRLIHLNTAVEIQLPSALAGYSCEHAMMTSDVEK